MSLLLVGFHTGQEYSSLLRTIDLKRVSIVLGDLSEKTLRTQFAILLAFSAADLTCVDHFMSQVRSTPRSFTLCEGRMS